MKDAITTADADHAALRWQQSIAAGTVDWAEFTSWLEVHPVNRRAYEALTLIDDLLAHHADTRARRDNR